MGTLSPEPNSGNSDNKQRSSEFRVSVNQLKVSKRPLSKRFLGPYSQVPCRRSRRAFGHILRSVKGTPGSWHPHTDFPRRR
jgi:hypothetical protein